jgi:hypothetical protein
VPDFLSDPESPLNPGGVSGGRRRTLAWLKQDPAGAELAEVTLRRDRLAAHGFAIGSSPVPYRLEYGLTTRPGFITSAVQLKTRGEGWERSLRLSRASSGGWAIDARDRGDPPFPPPGGFDVSLSAALDCDIAFSPLTNTMPVLRHGLLAGGGPIDFVMAWIAVPELTVVPYHQRYTHVGSSSDRRVVRYADVDEPFFTAELTFDADGFVIDYPGLARRI